MSAEPLALITGASSGIGQALARLHAARGGDVIGVARDTPALQQLQLELEARHGVRMHAITLDLGEAGAAARLVEALAQRGLQPQVLINNAGIGGLGPFAEQEPARLHAMLQLNIVTLTELTRLLLPGMRSRGPGWVLNVASAAAFMPGPLHAAYYASKVYVLSLSRALGLELRGSGISVTALCPGPTESRFLVRAGGPQRSPFGNRSATEVAALGYQAMLRGQAVAIPGWGLRLLLALLPQSRLARLPLRRNRAILDALPALSTRPTEPPR